MMKWLLSLLCLLYFAPSVYSDEPPCWCAFIILSQNLQYKADIGYSAADTLKEPWERKWTIKVYRTDLNDSLLWTLDFLHDGYGGGTLSNDGKLYVYVNSWLVMEYPNQIIVYTPDGITALSGKDLQLEASDYAHTVSHQIWLDDYYLRPDGLTDTTKLVVNTLDARKIEIDLKTKAISTSVQYPQFFMQNSFLKNIGYPLLIFMGLGILFLIFKKKKQWRNF